MSSTAKQLLLQALENRSIPLGEDDIAWAFDGANTRDAAASWAQEYLQPSTLLTKDELAVNSRYSVGTQDITASAGRPFSDADFEIALDALESSTKAIEKQCKILEKQKLALKKLQSQDTASITDNARDSRQARFTREKAQLDFELDDLSQSTGARLRSSIKLIGTTTGSIPSHVERLLEKDDRLLDGLQKLLPKLSDSSMAKDEAAGVEQLCSALATLSVEEIQARLDRVYRESLLDYSRRRTSTKELTDQQKKQHETVRSELQELGGEIDGLVSIVVDHQYRKPLRQGLLSAQAESLSQKAKWMEYTVSALVYLTSRLDAIIDHIQKLHAHDAALRAVSQTLDDSLAVEQGRTVAPQGASSPITDRAGAKGLKPLRLVQANLSEAQDPAIHFLREHDIRVADLNSTTKLSEILEAAHQERQAKLDGLQRSKEEAITEMLAQSVMKADDNMKDLLTAVFAQTNYNGVQIVDSNIQSQLDQLESDTQRIGEKMRGLDLDTLISKTHVKQREAMQKLVT